MLGGSQVLVYGVAAPLIFVSPTQMNFQVPWEALRNGAYARTATAADPIIVHLDNSLVTPDKPANPGEFVIVYATGVGNLNHMPVTGAASPSSPLSAAVDLPSVTVGGAPASVAFAGLTPGMVGLVQINTQLPATYAAFSSLPLVVTFAGASRPAVSLAVQGGSGAVSNVLAASTSWSINDIRFVNRTLPR